MAELSLSYFDMFRAQLRVDMGGFALIPIWQEPLVDDPDVETRDTPGSSALGNTTAAACPSIPRVLKRPRTISISFHEDAILRTAERRPSKMLHSGVKPECANNNTGIIDLTEED